MMRLTSTGFAGLLVLTACHSAPPPSVESPVQATMFEHFALARDLRSFSVSGDLDRLHVTAEALAEHEETWGMPPGADEYSQAIRSAARRAAASEVMSEASSAVAEIAQLCGECHLANETDLGQRFRVAAPRTNDPGIRHTNYLSWTSRLLWDGLVGPSDRMWSTGAGALVGADAFPAPRAGHVPPSELARARETLQRLGADAVVAADPTERARILSQIWTACSDCHVQAGIP